MTTEISKQEYLKRYLEDNKDIKKKHKRKLKPKIAKVSRLKIIDQDIDIKSIELGDKTDYLEEFDDEKPVVAEIIDDRPLEVQVKELYESSRWKTINNSDNQLSDSLNAKGKLQNSVLSSLERQKASKRSRNDSDSDISPPRHQKDLTRRKRHDSSSSDISLPRKVTKSRHDSDSDGSLPRNKTQVSWKRHPSCDLSPPRQKNISKKKNSSDISRVSSKNNKQRNSDSDISPPRSNRNSRQRNSDQDLSPPRAVKGSRHNKCNSDSDLSPPRSSSSIKSTEAQHKKPQKTLSGLKAGLQNSKTLRLETDELRKREKSQINMLDESLSGRNAETIVRDRKTGLKRDLAQEKQEKDEENKKAEEHQKKYSEWGKGIEQTQNRMEKFEDDLYEMSKPLARYQDDEDLDERLKAVIRDEDPMAAYIKRKKQKDIPSLPVYSGPPAPPNRFGIPPGYRWDGVDRSNGFEKRYFEKINSTKATQEESYLWSIQDM